MRGVPASPGLAPVARTSPAGSVAPGTGVGVTATTGGGAAALEDGAAEDAAQREREHGDAERRRARARLPTPALGARLRDVALRGCGECVCARSDRLGLP